MYYAKRVEWLRVFLARFVIVPSSHDLVLKWAEVMVTALHACSTEGRFDHHGLLRNHAKAPLHWAVIVDPMTAAPPRPVTDATIELSDDIVVSEAVSTLSR